MIRLARRIFRRFVPRVLDPWLDQPIRLTDDDVRCQAAYEASLAPSEKDDDFARARVFEGVRCRAVLTSAGALRGVVLDLASGSGGVTLALAAAGHTVVSMDNGWSETARLAHRRAALPYRHVIADAARLPFRDEVVGTIVCVETIEHLAAPEQAGSEASRVLASGGTLLLTTPARLGWLLRRDPHFGIRGLLLLPSAMQRAVAARRGFDQPHHYVDRIYTDARAVQRLFPGTRVARIMKRTRLPGRWFWESILLRKA